MDWLTVSSARMPHAWHLIPTSFNPVLIFLQVSSRLRTVIIAHDPRPISQSSVTILGITHTYLAQCCRIDWYWLGFHVLSRTFQQWEHVLVELMAICPLFLSAVMWLRFSLWVASSWSYIYTSTHDFFFFDHDAYYVWLPPPVPPQLISFREALFFL